MAEQIYHITDGGVTAFVGTLEQARAELCPDRALTEHELRRWCEDNSYEMFAVEDNGNNFGWRWKPGPFEDK